MHPDVKPVTFHEKSVIRACPGELLSFIVTVAVGTISEKFLTKRRGPLDLAATRNIEAALGEGSTALAGFQQQIDEVSDTMSPGFVGMGPE